MATYVTGDMLSDESLVKANYVFVTTNSFIKRNGSLVMGRGAAKQLRDKVPHVDLYLGTQVSRVKGRYGVVRWSVFGAFQVKYHFKDLALLSLIKYSTEKLKEFATDNPESIIFLNFPGIGNGGLEYDEVKPIIDTLPDNVWVWTLA